MKVAIIGSRNLKINCLEKYLPKNTTEIVSGGAKGIDNCAKEFAITNNIKLAEFLPDYKRYGKGAPLKRNIQIIEYADLIIAFWDGKSVGTKHMIETAKRMGLDVRVKKYRLGG